MMRIVTILVAAGLLGACSPPESAAPVAASTVAGNDAAAATPASAAVQNAWHEIEPVAMGDYEVVLDWPKPLPDTDLSHDGWTWGSGAGVCP